MKKFKNIEIILPLCLFSFLLISIICIKSSSYILPSVYENLHIKQLSWYFIGGFLYFVTRVIGNEKIYKVSSYIYFISCFLLFLVLFIGKDINGSKAWISLGNISFQPSELAKIGIILEISKILNKYNYKKNKTLKSEFILILKVFLVVLLPSILVFLEPDTGAVISYFLIGMIMLFISGLKLRWFVLLFSIITLCVFIFIYIYNTKALINSLNSSLFYRIDRILKWKENSGMQLENSLIAIGSSGIWGHGRMNTPLYFPEPYTDFIFAVYASNYGLFGSILFILVLLIFDIKIITVGLNAKKNIDKYIISGIISLIIFYQIQNISMTIGLLPITGVPLPFISYGGSSLIIYMILIAIVMNIRSKQKT